MKLLDWIAHIGPDPSGKARSSFNVLIRGISQEKLPDYLGFFQFVHNARRRGKLSSAPSSRASSPDMPVTTPKPDKNLLVYSSLPFWCSV